MNIASTLCCVVVGFAALGSNVAHAVVDPVGYWDFHTGLQNAGTAGSGLDATVRAGTPEFGLRPGAPSIVNDALVLDGTTSVQVPVQSSFIDDSFTIAAWYYQEPVSGRSFVFEASKNYNISYGSGTNNNSFTSYVGQRSVGSITTPLHEWNHVLHSFSSDGTNTTLSVYVNGAHVHTGAAATSAVNFAAVNVGDARDGQTRRLTGMIDELAVWDRSLGASEVSEVFTRGLAGTGLRHEGPYNLVLGANDESRSFAVNLTANELTKIGSGTLTLSGANAFDGTTIAGGTLAAMSDDVLGSGGVTLAGATLHLERDTTISNDIVLTAPADENVIRAAVAVDYLVVGGGGGGAGRDIGGGGGAGGLLSNLVKPEGPLAVGSDAYEVIVGAEGAGGIDSGSSRPGKMGGDSSFAGVVAEGGGGGNAWQYLGSSGGSGGGGDGATNRSGNPGIPGQGFPGGSGIGGTHYGGGGGGGAGQPGADAAAGKAGGDGLLVDIDGTNSYYAGGGGGAGHRTSGSGELGPGGLGGGGAAGINAGAHGAPNTGSGGGASRSTGGTGGDGGSGVVIVRYRGDPVATGGAISVGTGSAAGYTLHTFTDVGAHTLEFGPIGATVDGMISGTGGFTLDTPGTLTLAAANTHSGQTRVTAGTLALGNAEAVQNSTLNLAGGTAAFTAPEATAYTLGGLAGTSALDAGANELVVGGNSESTSYAGNLTAATLTKRGDGTLALHGSNTLGGTTIERGTLVAGASGALGGGPVTLAGGTLDVGHNTTTGNDIVLSGSAEENIIRAGHVQVDYLVVGGGGGGAGRDSSGGGGGGGVLSNLVTSGLNPLLASPGNTFDVMVGDGGAGGVNTTRGGNGESSLLASIVALGGGAGGPYNRPSADGASGGGGGREGTAVPGGAGTPGQGFPGGSGSGGANAAVDAGGGGGGAGGPGGDAVRGERGGHGGVGLAVDIDGFNAYYGGGGGGTPHRSAPTLLGGAGGIGGGGAGAADTSTRGNAGTPNTGGGGGASRNATSTNELWTGGDGGSGIVIARYLGNPVATGGTILAGTGSAEGYTLHTFSNTGSDSLQFDTNIVLNSTISGSMTGTGGFTWDSPGTLTLTGANDYTGATRIAAGTLALTGNGSIAGSATIDVHAGAYFNVAGTAVTYALSAGQTLTGSGTVVGDLFLDSDSIMSPGASIGALHFQDRLTLGAGSGIRWEFNGTGTAGVDYDSMIGVGEDAGLYLPDPDSGRIELSIFGPGAGLQAGDTFTLFDGDVFDHHGTLFDLGADLTGLFHIAADHSGWWGTWEVSAGSLILTAVPEPAAWLMLLSAAAAGLLVRRRRWS